MLQKGAAWRFCWGGMTPLLGLNHFPPGFGVTGSVLPVSNYYPRLALILKRYFVNVVFMRKVVYFRRNYAQVPGLLERCQGTINDINGMAARRLREVVKADEWEALNKDNLLSHFLLADPEEVKKFLKWTVPLNCFNFGDRKGKELPPDLSTRARGALMKWWDDDVRAWVVAAERELGTAQFNRVLFGGTADHLEIKVGLSVSFGTPKNPLGTGTDC